MVAAVAVAGQHALVSMLAAAVASASTAKEPAVTGGPMAVRVVQVAVAVAQEEPAAAAMGMAVMAATAAAAAATLVPATVQSGSSGGTDELFRAMLQMCESEHASLLRQGYRCNSVLNNFASVRLSITFSSIFIIIIIVQLL